MRRADANLCLFPFVFVAFASCSSSGSPVAQPVTETIGPEGGVITVDGATVTFPARALSTATSITITPTAEVPPPGVVALSRVYRCEPAGTAFAEEVTMAMTFQGDGAGARMFWSSGSDPTFRDVGGIVSGSVMHAGIRHFSAGFVGKNP